MPTTHRLYGGSNADIWLNCAGSTFLRAQVPRKPETDAMREGTAQHAVMEQLLRDENLKPMDFMGSTILGVWISKEMVDNIEVALDAYMEILEGYPEDVEILIETGVDLTDEAGGTADVIIRSNNIGATIDWKFGQIEVGASSEQGLFYGVCARKTVPRFDKVTQLDTWVVQPAFDPAMVKASYTNTQLDTAERDFLNAIAVSKSNNPTYTMGKWCTWCPAKLVCPAKTEGLDTLTRPEHILNLDHLGEQVAKLWEWESWLKEAEERIQHELEYGRPNKHFKLVQRRAIRKWKDEAKTVTAFRKAKVDDDTFMPRSLISPAQAEKGILSKKIVADLANPVSSGNTIALHSDKRPAVLPTAALREAINRVK